MMQREGLLLLIHGEVTDPSVDVFDPYRHRRIQQSFLVQVELDIIYGRIGVTHIMSQSSTDFNAAWQTNSQNT